MRWLEMALLLPKPEQQNRQLKGDRRARFLLPDLAASFSPQLLRAEFDPTVVSRQLTAS